MGPAYPAEARLETFECDALPQEVRTKLRDWWLAHPNGANTPNWDIALCCKIDGKHGLILVEAKSHDRELSEKGKADREDATANSRENHKRIGEAIGEAQQDLARLNCMPGIAISHERAYQLANRIAFAWKLATMGIPTVLIYLGFIDDKEIANVGKPFAVKADWHRHLRTHLSMAGDEPIAFECRTEAERFWLLSCTRDASRAR